MKVYLSDYQINKLKKASKKGEDVTLQIKYNKTPNYDIKLSKTQIDQVGKGKRITINGGFLPALIPLLLTAAKFAAPAIATGALSGLASSVVQKNARGLRHPFEGTGKKKKTCGKVK